MTPHRTKERMMKELTNKLIQNMSPVEARLISQGDSTIAPWLISKVFDNLTNTQAEAVAVDAEALIASWNITTTSEARKALRSFLGL